MEDEESLQTCALISQLSDSVQNQIYDFLSNGIVTTSIVVSGILLASDELLGVEKLPVCSSANLIYDGWLQIDKHSPGHVFAGSSLTEEGVEGVITAADGLVTGHLTIRLDPVFQTVQLPAGIANLDSGLSDVDRDALTHDFDLLENLADER